MKPLFYPLIIAFLLLPGMVMAQDNQGLDPLKPASLPDIPKDTASVPEFRPLTTPSLPDIDPLKKFIFGIENFSGTNSNTGDSTLNFLPDSLYGMNAREGYGRFSDNDSLKGSGVYGMGHLGTSVLVQSCCSTYAISSSGNYTLIGGDKTDDTRTFFTPAGDLGVIISNGVNEPTYYDGSSHQTFNDYVFCSSIDSMAALGSDVYVIFDNSKNFTPGMWTGFLLEITNGTSADEIRMVGASGENWFKVYNTLNTDATGYCIIGGIDRPAGDWSCTASSGCDSPEDCFDINGTCGVAAGSDDPYVVEFTTGNAKGVIRHAVYDAACATANSGICPDPPIGYEPSGTCLIYQRVMPRGNNCVLYKDCLFGTGGGRKSRIHFSYPGYYNAFANDAYLMAEDDVNYLLSFGGAVWVFMDESVQRIFGSGTSYTISTLIENIGCPAPLTVKAHGSNIYWLSYNGVWSTRALGQQYAEGEAGLSRISLPIENELSDINRGSIGNASAGITADGQYWLSVPTDTNTYPNETWVYDFNTQGWWLLDCAFEHFAYVPAFDDSARFLMAFQHADSGYVFNYGGTTDAGGAIKYKWKRVFDKDPVNEKAAKNVSFYGTLTGTAYMKVFEGEAVACAESLAFVGTGLAKKFGYFKGAKDERLTLELYTTDTDIVVRWLEFEYEDLGRKEK